MLKFCRELGVGRTRKILTNFVKFRKFCKNFTEAEVYGWSRQILKKSKKQKTPLPELPMPGIRPRYDPQLNCSIGPNFNIHPQVSAWMDVFLFTRSEEKDEERELIKSSIAGKTSDKTWTSPWKILLQYNNNKPTTWIY